MTTVKNNLELAPALVDLSYLNEWNQRSTDFVQLYKDGKLLRDTLYRVGGMGNRIGADYFTLLKYSEAKHTLDFLKQCYPDKKKKDLLPLVKHLDYRWVILDKDGNEKYELKSHQTPYIVKNSCIYILEGQYINIETGEIYGSTFNSIESENFIFIEDMNNGDKSKRGVKKICKKDGTWELFK